MPNPICSNGGTIHPPQPGRTPFVPEPCSGGLRPFTLPSGLANPPLT